MELKPGAKLGPYEILSPIGAGGMGQVWKARDRRLDRLVAIKISVAKFSERFEQEARAIAALNHPHICTLHDVGPDYLVMEYVEGPAIKGPLPLDQALKFAIQLAGALEAAHRKGITHRDLKPANILTTKSGVKILDFGLAKFEPTKAAAANGEALTKALTQEGSMVGTLQYMAPEQLQAKDTDARADIFSFGCVLYEMLTGKRAFDGANAASVIAAIMEREAPSVSEVAPPALDRVVKKCLAKDPDERWQTARDLKDELVWIAGGGTEAPRQAEARTTWFPWAVAGVLAAALIVAGAFLWRATRPVDRPLTRLSVDLGQEVVAGLSTTVAISPDGRRLVFPARGPDGKQQLATRLLDQEQSTLLPGTENGKDPFFSPDGQWIGFFMFSRLEKVQVQGGTPLALWPVSAASLGASWGDDGNIVMAPNQLAGLWRGPAAGGTPKLLTKLAAGEITHRWPQVLPGGRSVLFTASRSAADMESAAIEAISLETGQVKVVQRGGYYGRYLPNGRLVYVHQGVLFGVGFDPDRLEVQGAPTPLVDGLAANAVTGGGQFDFPAARSGPGTLVYLAGKGAAQNWQVAWLESSGKLQPLIAAPGAYTTPRFSPDGRKVAFGNGVDIYVRDMARDTTTRLTFTGSASLPAWTADGKHVVFQTTSGAFGISWIRSDGAGEPQRLLESPNNTVPWDFSPDGKRLAYFEINPETGFDLWTLPLDTSDPEHPKPGQPEPFLRTAADELLPRFSPDGRWVAYRSSESGTAEVYVRPFPSGSGGKWQISTDGGLYGIWSRDGRELFYETPDNRIMVVDYTVKGDSFIPGKPRLWSEKQIFYTGTSNLDLAPDGKRFAVLSMPETAPGARGSLHVTMILNFFDEVRRRIPAGDK